MKRFFSISLIAIFLSLANSCAKGGDDECEDVVCQNGGTCKWGVCDCPVGFAGPRCEIDADPYVRMTKVVILKYPQFDGNFSWDASTHPASLPDLAISVWQDDTIKVFESTPIKNAEYDSMYVIEIPESQYFDFGRKKHKIHLVDNDFPSEDDIMGTYYFFPYTDAKPASILMETDPEVQMEVFLTYKQ